MNKQVRWKIKRGTEGGCHKCGRPLLVDSQYLHCPICRARRSYYYKKKNPAKKRGRYKSRHDTTLITLGLHDSPQDKEREMNFDRDECGKIREKVIEAMRSLGLSAKIGTIRHNSNSASFKVEVVIPGEKAATVEQVAWETYALRRGFKSEDLYQQIVLNGRICMIAGWLSRNKKYPILLVDYSGKRIKSDVFSVCKALSERNSGKINL
jgi:uncharacterized Zn finger protein (UPF0148 family)